MRRVFSPTASGSAVHSPHARASSARVPPKTTSLSDLFGDTHGTPTSPRSPRGRSQSISAIRKTDSPAPDMASEDDTHSLFHRQDIANTIQELRRLQVIATSETERSKVLQSELARQRALNRSLKCQVADDAARSSPLPQSRIIAALKAKLGSQNNALAAKQRRIVALQEELASAQAQLRELERRAPIARNDAVPSRRMAELTAENERLTKEIDDLRREVNRARAPHMRYSPSSSFRMPHVEPVDRVVEIEELSVVSTKVPLKEVEPSQEVAISPRALVPTLPVGTPRASDASLMQANATIERLRAQVGAMELEIDMMRSTSPRRDMRPGQAQHSALQAAEDARRISELEELLERQERRMEAMEAAGSGQAVAEAAVARGQARIESLEEEVERLTAALESAGDGSSSSNTKTAAEGRISEIVGNVAVMRAKAENDELRSQLQEAQERVDVAEETIRRLRFEGDDATELQEAIKAKDDAQALASGATARAVKLENELELLKASESDKVRQIAALEKGLSSGEVSVVPAVVAIRTAAADVLPGLSLSVDTGDGPATAYVEICTHAGVALTTGTRWAANEPLYLCWSFPEMARDTVRGVALTDVSLKSVSPTSIEIDALGAFLLLSGIHCDKLALIIDALQTYTST